MKNAGSSAHNIPMTLLCFPSVYIIQNVHVQIRKAKEIGIEERENTPHGKTEKEKKRFDEVQT